MESVCETTKVVKQLLALKPGDIKELRASVVDIRYLDPVQSARLFRKIAQRMSKGAMTILALDPGLVPDKHGSALVLLPTSSVRSGEGENGVMRTVEDGIPFAAYSQLCTLPWLSGQETVRLRLRMLAHQVYKDALSAAAAQQQEILNYVLRETVKLLGSRVATGIKACPDLGQKQAAMIAADGVRKNRDDSGRALAELIKACVILGLDATEGIVPK